MTIVSSLIRFCRTRKLHTIVSKEIIKPSSPTPSHLKTYNLSVFDQSVSSTFIPMVTFFPNTGIYASSHEKISHLKNSFSQTLTKYYPFAGRHAKIAPTYVDCNDDGAEFLEASIDSTLLGFLQKSQHEDLDQLFPYGRIWNQWNQRSDGVQDDQVIPLAVQCNHFTCGGLAVAASFSHKIADASSLIHFTNDWARKTRQKDESLVDNEPHFIQFNNTNINFSEFLLDRSNDYVTRSIIFPNSKINKLKHKVITMTTESGKPILNPTRVDVLTWLLYKCAVKAATKNNLGHFEPTALAHPINIRGKMIEPLPDNSVGNILLTMDIQTKNEGEMKPDLIIGELQQHKMQIRAIKNIESAFAHLQNVISEADFEEQILKRFRNAYICSSLCRSSIYSIDFGWGKPIKATLGGNLTKNSFVLMDTPNNEGIEALVCLGKQDMEVFERDHELLSFC
uniref:acyltransferase Pun1-like n=1 Tax=Erigeron canadensis TaxID=72917 RepID=UPI001CB9B506|nr:acyltransferase Pun1-like [Erigeron canadensis]